MIRESLNPGLNDSADYRDTPRSARHDELIISQKHEKTFQVEILQYSNGLVDMIFEILCIQEKWTPNNDVIACSKCQKLFTLLSRKHHCRSCGRVFCNACSNYTLILKCKKWVDYPDIIQVFTKHLKCQFNVIESQFEMKICVSCFQSGLDSQISELSDIEGIKKYLKQSFTIPIQRTRRTSFTNASFPLKEKIQIEFMEFMRNELVLKLGNDAPSFEFIRDFITNVFSEFETLSKHKLDFNQVNICDLIPIVRLPDSTASEVGINEAKTDSPYLQDPADPDSRLSIEFFPGLILQLDSNTYYDRAHNISFPNILLLRKNFCPSKTKGNSCEGFKYFSVEDLDKTNKSNIDFIEHIISERNINVVISEHPLPTKIYFLLKCKKIDVIFPLKNSKINLIEKITKSSQLRAHFEKNYKHGISTGEVEELWLPGELEIKEVKILDRNITYYAYIKKNNPRKSFNTFSIIIRGPMNKQTKILKDTIQKLIPMLFYKFFEHTVVNSEMMLFNKFAKYDFSKSFLKSKISTMGHTHQLGNFLDTDVFFKSIIPTEYKLDYCQTFCMVQTEENTFNEFQKHYRSLVDHRDQLMKLLDSFDYAPTEFLTLLTLYSNDSFAFLANLNLSKSNLMLKMCDLPEHLSVKLFGQNDANVVKVVLDILNNSEILCPNCLYKFKFHRKFIYLNKYAIKLESYTIDFYNGDVLLPRIEHEPDFKFEKNPYVITRPNLQNNLKQLEDGKLRFGLYCETCQRIIGNLVVIPEAYRNMSYALFLYFYTLDLNMGIEEVEAVRDRKDTNRSTLFENMFRTQPELSDICVHSKLARMFLKDNKFVTYFKMPVTSFKLLTNSAIRAKPVDTTEKLSKIVQMQKNFKLLVHYHMAVLRILEELILEKPSDPNFKSNLQKVEKALEMYSMMLPIDSTTISDKCQLKANLDFLKLYGELANKFSTFRKFSSEEIVLQLETEVNFDNISKVVDYIQSRFQGRSEQEAMESWSYRQQPKIQETISHIDNSQINKDSFNSSNYSQSFMLMSKKSQGRTEIDKFSMPFTSVDTDNRFKPSGEFIVGDCEFIYFDSPVNKYANFLYSLSRARRDSKLVEKENQLSREITLKLNDELETSKLDFILDSDDETIFYNLFKENRLLLVFNFRRLLAYKFTTPMEKTAKFRLKEYFPQAFQNLRYHLKIEDDYFMHSLSQISNFNPSGGQTQTSFFITRDNKYVIKEVGKREFGYFMDFCLDYVKYMFENSSSKSPSFLCRIYGVFKSDKRFFVVMENLNYYIDDLTKTTKNYDLKGSELNRFKAKVKPNSTLTDTNYLIDRNGDPLYLDASAVSNLWQILSRDSLFLEQKNIIDYSLFLSIDVDNQVCFMKVIDYFRKYDVIKNVEEKFKKMRNKDLPTIINPQEYRARFLHNSRRYFIFPE